MNLGLFDEHRFQGQCWELDGVLEEDGIVGTPEGHERRKILSERFSKK